MVHILLVIIYISFISLGLPDAILGSVWPDMYEELNASISYAGIICTIISAGTVVSSLMSDILTRILGVGKVTAISVAMTAFALIGFSVSSSFWMLCLWSIPYGIGAGSVDASLNNYVALHYASRHMSWLHCMWGIGASAGPYIMGYILSGGKHWSEGYRVIGIFQIALTAVLIFSIPMWKNRQSESSEHGNVNKSLSFREIINIAGVKEIMIMFFCYCALEQTAGLWASSYLVFYKGIDAKRAASFASIFFIGITVGRAINGFLTMKFKDRQLIIMGQAVILAGIIVLFLPFGESVTLAGLILIGLGCAPIYPCVIHSTPELFGKEQSQAIIGVQMACAYVGICAMPSIFGVIADYISIVWYPVYLLGILVVMYFMYSRVLRKVGLDKKVVK